MPNKPNLLLHYEIYLIDDLLYLNNENTEYHIWVIRPTSVILPVLGGKKSAYKGLTPAMETSVQMKRNFDQ